jgi:ABC-2 type transport system permease protein
MTFADRLYTLWFTARLSGRDFLAHFPPKAYLLSMVPRAVLQVTFLGYLGYYAAGDAGREFAFVGACVQIMVLETIVRGPDVMVQERVLGTLHRLRLGAFSLPAIMSARWWIYVCAGVGDAIVAIFLAGLLLGELDLAPELLAALPLFVLIAITTSTIGLVVGAISLTQRVDTLMANAGAYALMVFGGVVAPISAFGDTGELIARFLPLTNGLLAIRATLDDESWLGYAALELGVGAVWAALAFALIGIQAQRARARGSDELL